MRKTTLTSFLAVFALGLLTTTGYGQLDGLYEFDGGGDGTSWDDAANWEQVLDPNGNPISGDPAAPPSNTTSADIPMTGVVIDNTMPGQTALDVSIGTANGVGSLNISGGGLTGRDITAGADGSGANNGSIVMSGGTLDAGDDITLGGGSVGTMNMSGGTASTSDDFTIDTDSSLTMTGGTINVGDRINALNNAEINLDGGDILADDDFFFFNDSQVTVNGGTLVTHDKMRFDDDPSFNGRVTINGGVVRSNEFGLEIDGALTDFRGVVEINGDGVYQVEESGGAGSPISQLSLQTARDLINEGVPLVTSEPSPLKLGASRVTVPLFDGRTDVSFIQIAVVPEPASALLFCCGALGLVLRRRRS